MAVPPPSEEDPRVWILLGNRTGDDNQLRALATALGWPLEAKTLRYNGLRHFPPLRDERLLHLTPDARATLQPPWPDLVIGLGYESLPVARFIRRQSGGRTRLVQIGNPRSVMDDIDLVIATPQYPLPNTKNLLRIPLPIGNPASTVAPTREEERWLQAMPRPRRLVAVGGSTRQWKLDARQLDLAIQHLREAQKRAGGSLIAVTSRRTPPEIKRFLEKRLTGDAEACVHDFPRFATLLARCDEFHVTADSVSMLSEAILTGKPVGVVPIRRSIRGKVGHVLRGLGVPLKAKADLTAFWGHLADNGLAGTVEAPVAARVPDTTRLAVEAVRHVFRRARTPRVWALLGARQGDNNQVLALAELLGLEFECKRLTFNRWRHLGPRVLGSTFLSLTKQSRKLVTDGVPDLTISAGHRSVPIVQALRAKSGGRIRSIHIGYPRISPGKFDLVVATPEYPIADHPHLLRIPFALARATRLETPSEAFWASYPPPRKLIVLGGPTLFWRLDPKEVSTAIDEALVRAAKEGGSVLVVSSPRTPVAILKQVETQLEVACAPAALIAVQGPPTYSELLALADSICVTADSVAMTSDAIASGKRVSLVPIKPTSTGRVSMTLMEWLRPGSRLYPRDLRFFWAELKEGGLIGQRCDFQRRAAHDPALMVAARLGPVLTAARR